MTLLVPTSTSPTLVQREPTHLNFLDGLRGLAALYVVFHHAFLMTWQDPLFFPHGPVGWLTLWLCFGHQAVTVFIVLSGFCLMLPVARAGGMMRGGIKRFFQRRARRIIPPYYLALFLTIALLFTLIGKPTGTFWDTTLLTGKRDWIKGIFTHLLLVDDFFDSGKINYVFWSVAVECQIYFLFPLLVLSFRRPGPLTTTALALALSFSAAIAVHNDRLRSVRLHYVGIFTLGMFAAHLAIGQCGPLLSRAKSIIPWRSLAAAAFIIAAIIGAREIVLSWSSALLVDFLIAIATIGLIIPACAKTSAFDPVRSLLSAAPVVWLGTFSYSLYLVHAPLLQLVWQCLIRPLHVAQPETFLILALVGVPLIILAAYLFYLPCERPFIPAKAVPVVAAIPVYKAQTEVPA